MLVGEDATEDEAVACVREVLSKSSVRQFYERLGVLAAVQKALAKLQGKLALIILAAWRKDLPCRESRLTPVSAGLSAAVRCNTAPLVLGSDVCAKAALFYLVKYMTKDSAELNVSLSVLADARKHIDRYPSTAADAGCGTRLVKHFLQRALQRVDMELADTQAASCAMGEMADFWSDAFVPMHLHATMQGAMRLSLGKSLLSSLAEDAEGECVDDESDVSSEASVTESAEEFEDAFEGDEADVLLAGCGGRLDMQVERQRPRSDRSGRRARGKLDDEDYGGGGVERCDTGNIRLFEGDGGKIRALPAVYHYAYRGRALARFNQLEYVLAVSLRAKLKKKQRRLGGSDDLDTVVGDGIGEEGLLDEECAEDDEESFGRAGRQANSSWPFASTHILHGSHEQAACSKLRVPHLVGPRPPRLPPQLGPDKVVSGKWLRSRRLAVRFLVAVFVPWPTGNADVDDVDPARPAASGEPCAPAMTEETLHRWIVSLQETARCSATDAFSAIERDIARDRLRWLDNFVHALDVDDLGKYFTVVYRGRCRDLWPTPSNGAVVKGVPAAQEERDGESAIDSLRAMYEGRRFDSARLSTATDRETWVTWSVTMMAALGTPPPRVPVDATPIDGGCACCSPPKVHLTPFLRWGLVAAMWCE